MDQKRTILFNLSGAKCATTWLSECFKSGRGAYSNYSTTYFSKFFPLPDLRHAREGYVSKKIIYGARLKASLENLRVEDQIFMDKAKSHEFRNIGSTDEVALELTRLIQDYKGDIIYLGDPNIHYWMKSYFDVASKLSDGKFALANYLNSLRKYGYEPRFMLIRRPLIDQYKSYLKMVLLNKKSANVDGTRRHTYEEFLGLSEDAMLEARIQDTVKIMAANPLYALHRLGKQKGLNINVDVFNFDSIRENASKFAESIANTYSIKNFCHDKSVSTVINKSKQYEARDAEIIDRVAEKIVNSSEYPPELLVMKSIEKFLLKKIPSTNRYLPTKIPLELFGQQIPIQAP